VKTIRKPRLTEIAAIKRLLDGAAEEGAVLRRPLMELYENVRDFYTYVDEQGVGGCCALHIDMVDLAEIRSLVVRPDLRGSGVGKMLLTACMEEARSLNIARVYCLTRNPDFFGAHGFSQVEKQDLPHKVFNDCVRCSLFPDCDEIAMTCMLSSEVEREAVKHGVRTPTDVQTATAVCPLPRHRRRYCLAGICIIVKNRRGALLLLDQYLNLRQVVLGIALEQHAGTFDVHFPRRQQRLVAFLLDVAKNLRVRPAQFLIGSLMDERHASPARQFPHRDAFHLDLFTQRNTRFEVRVILAVLAVVIQAQWLPA
jgi:amino-acid N-acetyltransferase